MKKVIFGITNLNIGGAERLLVDLLCKLAEKQEITVFTIYGNGLLTKDLPQNVEVKSLYEKQFESLNKLEKRWLPIKLFLQRKKIYQKQIQGNYDVEIAFLEGPITYLFAGKGSIARKIAWVHSDIAQIFGTNSLAKVKKKVGQKLYQNYQDIVFVSNLAKNSFEKMYPENTARHHVIYNYIDEKRIEEKAQEEVEFPFDETVPNFLTIARLVKEKGVERFLSVHDKLIQEGFNHKVYVIGDGPCKEEIEERRKLLGRENSFILLGQIENPYPYLKQCQHFCLFSFHEGLPITVLEAKTLKKRILITDTAAKESLQNYEKSMILENTEDGIYSGMKQILQGEKDLQGESAEGTIGNASEEILKQIEELIGG